MSHLIIDSHAHLWKNLKGNVNGFEIKSLGGGKASFMGELRQMMPPYIINGENTVEIFLSNMDYAGVSGAVITQEYIDGNQDDYLLDIKKRYPNHFKICGLAELRQIEAPDPLAHLLEKSFDGIKLPAQWLTVESKKIYFNTPYLMAFFKKIEEKNLFLSIDLAEGDQQVKELEEIIQECPKLRVAIGHFGMVNRPNWQNQIALAKYPNVVIESGGMTWLFHKEFYPYKGAIKAIKESIDLIGENKILWGSDYPRTMTAITYKMSYDFIIKTKELSQDVKTKFLGENAKRFYGFNEFILKERIKNMVED